MIRLVKALYAVTLLVPFTIIGLLLFILIGLGISLF